jgi:hypothetical protein
MAKSPAKRAHDAADRAFNKAWKLLDRIERRMVDARAEERKRLRQLGDGTGRDAEKRSVQLEVARVEVARIEASLTELSELIAANARAQSRSTVSEIAREVAASIREDAAEAAVPTPLVQRSAAAQRRRHHRKRSLAAAMAAAGITSSDSGSPPTETAVTVDPAIGPTATEPGRETSEPAASDAAEPAASDAAASDPPSEPPSSAATDSAPSDAG